MTLAANDGVSNRELATSELEAISGGLHLSFGPNPPRGGEYGEGRDHDGGRHHEPHHGYEPPHRYYPGGSPNSPGLLGFI